MEAVDRSNGLQGLAAAQIALGTYVALGSILAYSAGMWAGDLCLFFLCSIYAAFIARCVVRSPSGQEFNFDAQAALAVTLLCCAVVLAIDPGLFHAKGNVWQRAMTPVLACLVGASLVLALAGRWKLSMNWFHAAAAAACVSLIALRLLAIGASPSPWIDVFPVNNRACDLLFEGANPYTGEYEDLYGGRYGYRPTFFYWPATLYWNLAFRGILGDVRYGMVVADALTAVCLWLAARRTLLPGPATVLLPLVWLAFPVSLFVIEQAWIDPLLMLGVAAVLLALKGRRWWLCGIALGSVAATKQYAGLIGIMTLAWLAGRDVRAARHAAVATAVSFVALMAPMVCWDPPAFYRSTIENYLHAPPRRDGLGIAAMFLQRDIAVSPLVCSAISMAAITALCVGCALSRDRIDNQRRWGANLAAVFWTCFLFGKFAFCNYYYMVAFLLLVFFVASWPGPVAPGQSSA